MPPFIFAALLALVLVSSMTYADSSPAERLAESVRFQTVSYQDRDQIDYAEFQRFHHFLRETYPRVYAQLEVETINNYSLLIRWPGSDTNLKPIDVISSETERMAAIVKRIGEITAYKSKTYVGGSTIMDFSGETKKESET